MLTSSGSQQTMVLIVSWPRGKPVIFSKIGQEREVASELGTFLSSRTSICGRGHQRRNLDFHFYHHHHQLLGARAIVISLGSLDGRAGGWTGERKEIRNLEQFSRRSGIKRAVYDDGVGVAPSPSNYRATPLFPLPLCISLWINDFPWTNSKRTRGVRWRAEGLASPTRPACLSVRPREEG